MTENANTYTRMTSANVGVHNVATCSAGRVAMPLNAGDARSDAMASSRVLHVGSVASRRPDATSHASAAGAKHGSRAWGLDDFTCDCKNSSVCDHWSSVQENSIT